ncbi:M20 family metallo-hydrolase [Paenibacillus soyae]|uniref:M20 family metallo-hydrolase n=1 Tax=Paenibacillus soyae TaxID=2969249 RepID=A0A9X2MT48_9BACL|nr:M20 family metallo-hydrolase [Paenibacillus soyae]MCR2807613.1 M20 family metallo-hydrolase [Paenibacillus soyae]
MAALQVSKQGIRELAKMGLDAPLAEQGKEKLLQHLETTVMSLLDVLAACSSSDGSGVTRLLFSEEWLEAQLALKDIMAESGLVPSFDEAGNLFGKLQGSEADLPSIITGSHIDTVVDGGRYDGAYGIAAALAAVRYLRETYGVPVRSIEVVSLSEEEGSRFPMAYWGSGSIAGERGFADIDDLEDVNGVSFRDAMRACGFGEGSARAARRDGADLAAFVELHIEQGAVLEREGMAVGVVDAIVGQRRFVVTLTGEANHAGTTPMPMRKDALEGACAMITMLREEAVRQGGPLVATAGRMLVSPNVPNVVPGKVEFTVDVRHSNPERLEAFCGWFADAFREAAESRGLELACSEWFREEPAPMNEELKELLDGACAELGISSRRMASGAGHDAQMFSRVCPSAMLFVPSRGGISHSPEEYTSPRELAIGALVLAKLLYKLGYEGERV